MVAPIALYPDKLVAQILAGSTFPVQVSDADQWLTQNKVLKAGPLADAASSQPWDASIKSLTAFRRVLDQMAKNLPWTTALGQAYYNDPDDVMNAIQVMRQRATQVGHLKSTPQLHIATSAEPNTSYTPNQSVPPVYTAQPIIAPPPQYITIEPTQPNIVYVPSYNPQQIYGAPVAAYPGYDYVSPAYIGYSNLQIATAGFLTFGLGVVVGSAFERHGWGWNSWGVNWGRPSAYLGNTWGPSIPAFDRPTVVYNRTNYISNSSTVVNNIHNNIYNNIHNNIHNTSNFTTGLQPQLMQQQALQVQQAQQVQQQQTQQARQQQVMQVQQQQAQQARQQQVMQVQQQQAQQARQQQAMQVQQQQAQQARQQQAMQVQQQQAQQARQQQAMQVQQQQAYQQAMQVHYQQAQQEHHQQVQQEHQRAQQPQPQPQPQHGHQRG